MKLAGLQPYAILFEFTNIDGTMAKLPEIILFAQKHDYPVVSISDIIEYRIALRTIFKKQEYSGF